MLRNVRVTTFTVSELLTENQQGGGVGVKLPPTQIRVKQLKQLQYRLLRHIYPINVVPNKKQTCLKYFC